MSWVPWAWAEQIAAGGLVLVDVKVAATAGNLVLLRRYDDRLEGRFDNGGAAFMHMRTPVFPLAMSTDPDRDRANARQWVSDCAPLRMPWDDPTLWFLIHLRLRERVAFGYAMDSDGQPGNVFFSTNDGAWCEVAAVIDGQRDVWEGGPRDLWRVMSEVITEWEQLDRPDWERFGLTVTPDVQTVWLDDPEIALGAL